MTVIELNERVMMTMNDERSMNNMSIVNKMKLITISSNNEVQMNIYSYDPTYRDEYDKVVNELDYFRDEEDDVKEVFMNELDIDLQVVRQIDDGVFKTDQGEVRVLSENEYENFIGNNLIDLHPKTINDYYTLSGRHGPDYSPYAFSKLQKMFEGKDEGQLFLMMMTSIFGNEGIDWLLELQHIGIKYWTYNDGSYYIMI